MPNEISKTDQFVRRELEKFNVTYEEQSSSNPEIKKALKGASKTGNGEGKPEFILFSNDNLIVIENKLSYDKLVKHKSNEKSGLDLEIGKNAAVSSFAVNGAVHYAINIAQKTNSFKEVIAIGIVGDHESYIIQPYFVSANEDEVEIRKLTQLKTILELHPNKINEWYDKEILGGELTREQKDILKLQKIATELHEDLRNYGSLEGENKATVVSAILLALLNDEFHESALTANAISTDGSKVYDAVDKLLKQTGAMPADKVDVLLNKFSFLKTNVVLNAKNDTLKMTPIRYYTTKLRHQVFPYLLHHENSGIEFDILGNFYGEFVKYGGGDGNSLGIVLTPSHITSLMTKLIEIKPHHFVLDPACGTGAFLISAMNAMIHQIKNDKMLNNHDKAKAIANLKKNQLLGIEMQEKMFTIATTNMILRGDGKSRLQLADMFKVEGCSHDEFEAYEHEKLMNATSGDLLSFSKEKRIETSKKIPFADRILFNPPYAQGKNDKKLTEISFILHALNFLTAHGKMAVIVPQSTMVGKSKEEKMFKKKILDNHTLEAVITLNKNTFYGVGVNPCIALFTAAKPHSENKKVKFVNFEDDGFIVRKHVGLIDDGTSVEKRQFLIDVLEGNNDDYSTKFMVKSEITFEDEWLHSFFYFNDEIPSEADFEKTMADYLTFQVDMYAQGRGYLFENEKRMGEKKGK